MAYKKNRNLIEYAREIIDLYEDHDRSRDDVAFHIIELELDMALTKMEIALYNQRRNIIK